MPLDPPRHLLPPSARVATVAMGDGWSVRTLELDPDGPARGTLLFQGGRGDFLEKYAEEIVGWAARGWRVRSFDWRGQGGSGRLGRDGAVGHATDFGPWIGDLAALAAGWRAAAPGPFVAIGHSMGGHLVLRALVERALVADAAVLVAPMIGTAGPSPAIGRWMAAALSRLGEPDRAAWRANDKPGRVTGGRQALLTHDDGRYAAELWWREHHPELIVGPPSWSWLAAAYRSSRASFTSARLAAVATPTLVLSALADRLVDPDATRRAAEAMPNAELIEYGEASRHEILREVDGVRDHALAAIDDHLDRHASA